MTMPETSHAPSASALPTWWERSWALFDRWVPHVLLVASTAMSLANPEHSSAHRAGTLGLAVLTGAWVALAHTFAPPHRREQPLQALVYVVGLLVFAAALMARDPAFFVFTISGFLHAGLLRPRPLIFVGTGATSFLILYVTSGGIPRTAEELGTFVSILLIQTVLIGFGMLGSEKLHLLNEERRRTVDELQQTMAENEGLHAQLVAQAHEAGTHDERQRMARAIHDTVAQGLTGVITQLEAAEQGIDDPAMLRRHLANAAGLARTSLRESRRSMQALAPGALARGRLEDALDGLVADWAELVGVAATATVTGTVTQRSADVEVGLLRVVQEALANVAKHADATRVGVTLSELGDQLLLDVRDDGRGFDPAAVDTGASFGLTTMRQRIADLGGELAVESDAGVGTAVSATIPSGVVEPEPSGG